mgnify:CR=1 FL=1
MTEYRDFADEWQQAGSKDRNNFKGAQSMSDSRIEHHLYNINCTLREAVTALRVIARALILLVLFQFLHYIL